MRERFDDAPEQTLDTVLRAFQKLQNAAIPGIIELAPAYTSVAVFFDPIPVAKAAETPDEMFDWLATRIGAAVAAGAGRGRHRTATQRRVRLVEIPVCYDPEFALDIDHVARRAAISPGEVIRLHSGANCVACISLFPDFHFWLVFQGAGYTATECAAVPVPSGWRRTELSAGPRRLESSVAHHCGCSSQNPPALLR